MFDDKISFQSSGININKIYTDIENDEKDFDYTMNKYLNNQGEIEFKKKNKDRKFHLLKFLIYILTPISFIFIYVFFPLYPMEKNKTYSNGTDTAISYNYYLYWFRSLYNLIDNILVASILAKSTKLIIFSNWIFIICFSIVLTLVDILVFNFLYSSKNEGYMMKNIGILAQTYFCMIFYLIINEIDCFKNKKFLKNNCYNKFSNSIEIEKNLVLEREKEIERFTIKKCNNCSFNIYLLHNKYILGGKLQKETQQNYLILYHTIITTLMLHLMYLFCSFCVDQFIRCKTFIDKNYAFLIFYVGWFLIGLIIKYTLRLWKTKLKNGIFVILIAINQFFYINYRMIFLDKNFFIFEALFLLFEISVIEFLNFYLPMTKTFYKFSQKYKKISKILGYEGDQEYMHFKISLFYFLKLISIIWSILGTLVEFFAIYFSNNAKIFNLDFLDDIFDISIKMIFTLFVELVIYFLIALFLRKKYNIHSWKNYLICISDFDYTIISILFTIHILQDPIFTIINKLSLY